MQGNFWGHWKHSWLSWRFVFIVLQPSDQFIFFYRQMTGEHCHVGYPILREFLSLLINPLAPFRKSCCTSSHSTPGYAPKGCFTWYEWWWWTIEGLSPYSLYRVYTDLHTDLQLRTLIQMSPLTLQTQESNSISLGTVVSILWIERLSYMPCARVGMNFPAGLISLRVTGVQTCALPI